jgi:DNA-binding winged helix-turn-helix (wHTH) protein/tetratricopeptide (TPR) repeat protein
MGHICAARRYSSCPFRWYFYGRIAALFMPEIRAVPAQGNGIYRFADCELDPHERRLLVRGQPVILTPKVFDTLVLLVERAGHVVSKDELMATLWPRGFVHESNLTKHIWIIRCALGNGEDENRYIETVPKLGYRFIAPVQRVAHEELAQIPPSAPVAETSTPTTAAIEAAPSAGNAASVDVAHDLRVHEPPTRSESAVRKRRVWIPAAIAVVAVAVVGFFGWRAMRAPAMPMSSQPGNAVAIVAFNNLSGNAKDAWLGPALTEMLAMEIAASGKLHVVPDELVRSAHADLPMPMAGGYAPASLGTLRRRLGSEYVLSGSYLVFGAPNTPQLRLDVAVQNARNGATVTELSRSGAVADLPALVTAAGADLRDKLGAGALSADALRSAANAQPPTAEVARHLGFALEALHEYDPSRARDELLQAIAQAPGYAPAYLYLAQAWSALGYRAKAVAAAKQALANAKGLPDEERLQIEAQQHDLQGDRAQTIAAYTQLIALRPQNPEYRLQLVAALIHAGKYDEADAALAGLRNLPELDGDPRTELAAANIASGRGDAKARIAHARRALQWAQARGEPGLAANAELQLGIALDQDHQAEPLLRAAAADFRRIGNPHGEALAWQNLANLMDARNRIADARETYQHAMAIYQGVGDLGGEAAIYDDLSRMLWAAGDRDGTETALRQALRIGQETNDLTRQAWSLTGLATVLSDASAGDEVAAMYRQAITLDEQAGQHTHHVFALAAYGDLLRQRGELDRARDVCGKAQMEARALGAADSLMTADFECAQIALDRGEPAVAESALQTLLQKAITTNDTFSAANAQLVLGQIAMGRRQWAQARDRLQAALKDWTASEATAGQANTEALLAICYAELGDAKARDHAIAQARDLRSRVNQHQEVFYLDIALAELQAYTGKPDEAIATLSALADDAAKRRWIGLAFEARLAAQRVLDRGPSTAVAEQSRAALLADARQAGFGWVTQRLTNKPE